MHGSSKFRVIVDASTHRIRFSARSSVKSKTEGLAGP